MSRRSEGEAARLLERLCADPDARLAAEGDGFVALGVSTAKARVPEKLVRVLLAGGLLREAEPGRLSAAPAAQAWLRRRAAVDTPFRRQHSEIAMQHRDGESVLVNLEESPVAALARRRGGSEPWLAAHAVSAAERLRSDFERAQLQPRVTANWSASVNTGRRADGGTVVELTEMALAARQRFDRAIEAVGPDLSGVLVDVCCFLKGLETVERERQWPARSAKLVLRLALDGLSRHYGLTPAAAGREASGGIRHWGAEGYRPQVT
jgi:hypothetical protein